MVEKYLAGGYNPDIADDPDGVLHYGNLIKT